MEQQELKREGLRERLATLVEETLAGSPAYLIDVVLRGRTGSQVVDVYVDGDAGLDVEQIAALSREIGFALDLADLIPGRYQLNVSSPGAERPLRLPRQYPKHVGRLLEVEVEVEEGAQHLQGKLVEVGPEGIQLAADGAAPRFVPFSAIRTAKVRLPW